MCVYIVYVICYMYCVYIYCVCNMLYVYCVCGMLYVAFNLCLNSCMEKKKKSKSKHKNTRAGMEEERKTREATKEQEARERKHRATGRESASTGPLGHTSTHTLWDRTETREYEMLKKTWTRHVIIDA